MLLTNFSVSSDNQLSVSMHSRDRALNSWLAQVLRESKLFVLECHSLETDAWKPELVSSKLVLQDNYPCMWQEGPPLKHLPSGMSDWRHCEAIIKAVKTYA